MSPETPRYADEMDKAVKVENGHYTKNLANYIRTKREDAGLSMREAARRAGISEARWRQLESGHQVVRGAKVEAKPTEGTVLAIASTLNMNPDVAFWLAGIESNVVLTGTGIWPLPKSRTMQRDPGTGKVITGEPHVSSSTVREAKMRLHNIQRLIEQIQKLPKGDKEYLLEYVEQLLAEDYLREHELEERHARDVAQLQDGYTREQT